jgi:hypothetical protein
MFDRKSPCRTCPFRTGETGLRHLGTDRAEEIVESLMSDETFTCHGDLGKSLSKRQHCVGAMLMLEKIDRPNQMMRIGERIGRYDRTKLRGAEDVFESFDDWVEAQEE